MIEVIEQRPRFVTGIENECYDNHVVAGVETPYLFVSSSPPPIPVKTAFRTGRKDSINNNNKNETYEVPRIHLTNPERNLSAEKVFEDIEYEFEDEIDTLKQQEATIREYENEKESHLYEVIRLPAPLKAENPPRAGNEEPPDEDQANNSSSESTEVSLDISNELGSDNGN